MKHTLKFLFTKRVPIEINSLSRHFQSKIIAISVFILIISSCEKAKETNPYDGTWTFNLTYSTCSTVSYTSTTSHAVSLGQFGFSGVFTGDTCTPGSGVNYTFSGTIDNSGNLKATLSGSVEPGGATYANGICGTKTACSVSHNAYSNLILSR